MNSIFTYISGREEADKVVAAVAGAGAKAVAIPLDTGDSGSFDAFVEKVRLALEGWGTQHIDYLVTTLAFRTIRRSPK